MAKLGDVAESLKVKLDIKPLVTSQEKVSGHKRRPWQEPDDSQASTSQPEINLKSSDATSIDSIPKSDSEAETNWQQTDNKPATNKQQTDNKVATNRQQSGNKFGLFRASRFTTGYSHFYMP